ncbi:MAG: hypothetical protein AB7U95_34170 [Reyranella sp.]
MADGINVQLKEALDEWLKQIHDQLAAQPVPARQPASKGWTSAKPTSSDYPMDSLGRLDELIKALNDASLVQESARNVGRLALQMRKCKSIVKDLEITHKFSSIRLVRVGKNALEFSRIRECIELASNYYERLAYYQTREGKDFLRGVTSVGQDLDKGGDVAVRDHHFDERIDPLAVLRWWDFGKAFVSFAQKRLKEKADPLDHVVDFLISRTQLGSAQLINNYLYGYSEARQARLHATEPVGDLLNVQVLTHVPGDDRFSTKGPPRMWTYQVKVPHKTSDNAPAGWVWSAEAWSEAAFSLPILRVIHTVRVPSERAVSHDFSRGTLYAMKGVTAMRCYPSTKFHSALFEGHETSAAGMLVADDGRVVAIDNRSGHYQPGYQQLQTAVQFLESNLLFEPGAFVSVYVTDHDALYFEPADFLHAARRQMNYRVVADFVAKRARDYGHLPVPVAQRHAGLIPPALSGFPVHNGRNRWDGMLAEYYGGDLGLEAIVKDLMAALRLATSGNVSGWASGHLAQDRVTEHVSLARQTMKTIEAGGAYCHLAGLVDKLVRATQLGKIQERSLLEAQVRYRSILERLSTLSPRLGLM